MAKSLELQFVTSNGKTSNLTFDNPIEPINPSAVKQAMDQIIAANVFEGHNGTLVSAKGARVIERNVTEYELA
ncbi:DUF2922 domain-containing protein [Cytobacillus spongiae]|jgi:hypothetical protein|uniref:DUF2922 domain-containing protein n=1 Tax=Cytobacillus spongiae TaxID=2901381 RepID=UPI001F411F5B|nr:DUF2922 domain-containing protein [Cytobacillus spongiae]UII57677.1 DUF2922 domain-containing protein [Cytobacillus spongiae]